METVLKLAFVYSIILPTHQVRPIQIVSYQVVVFSEV